MTDNRDWDKELAKIDRLMGKDPGPAATPPAGAERAGSPAAPSGPPTAAPAVPDRAGQRRPAPTSGGTSRGGFAVWLITLLGPVGVVALTVWPYPRDCGMLLWVYLVGVAAVLAAGIWAMRTAWESRRGLPMVIGLATLLAALVLASAEVLPRVGYAAHELTWTCST